MTIENLLIPRIKVIAPMPLMTNAVGSFLELVAKKNSYFFGINTASATHFYPISVFQEWKHIFKILEWYEERNIEDMPKYLKSTIKDYISEVEWDLNYHHSLFGEETTGIGYREKNSDLYFPITLKNMPLPATEQEYFKFVNSK